MHPAEAAASPASGPAEDSRLPLRCATQVEALRLRASLHPARTAFSYRLLRLVIALVLRNCWLQVRRQLGEKCPGRIGVHLPRKFLPCKQFLGWLTVAIRQIWPLRPPETVVAQRQRTPHRRRRLDWLRRKKVA